jgi:S-adenosylmethionine:tRNA ribosyltransferase-isomerase
MENTPHLDYTLPRDRIANAPARPRDASRLLVIDRATCGWTDSRFRDLVTHLREGDVLVLNNTRVLRARVFASLTRTGRPIEVLFAQPLEADRWQVLLRPGRRVRGGDTISAGGDTEFVVEDRRHEGGRIVRLTQSRYRNVIEFLEAEGVMPLPPYLDRPATTEDDRDYQTVFSSQPGAVAAPTAGLHFSPAVFEDLRAHGVEVVELTLHVGLATFLPVRADDPGEHVLTPERYSLPESTAHALNRARADGRRIIAVGTTTTRTLEHALSPGNRFVAGTGETDLFILPGYRFRAIDGLLTNFHLPRSTLILLVAAFASRRLVLDSYEHALASGYRFYSYGDCCLFL